MKNIKTRVIFIIIPFVMILCGIVGGITCMLNYRTATSVLEQNLSETAQVAADRVAAEIKSIKNVAIDTGTTALLADPAVPVEQKKDFLAQRAKSHNFQRGNLLNSQGISLFDGNDYSDRDYFKAAIQGRSVISDPTISKITGKITFLISAPVWKDGVSDSTIVGVVYYAPNEDFLNQIVSKINISPSSNAFLLNKIGTTIADRDMSLVAVDNHIKEAENDPSLKDMAAIHSRMIAGETGYDTYKHEGKKWVQGFSPVPETDGWSVAVTAWEEDFLKDFYLAIWVTLLCLVGFLILGTVVSIIFGNQIGNPIRACAHRLEQLAEGDLDSPVPPITSQDEIGILAASSTRLIRQLHDIVEEVSGQLTTMSQGDFRVSDLPAYPGNFLPFSTATNQIVASLHHAFSNINQASLQVSGGSSQIADGAQALSQSSSEQANSTEELSTSIAEISDHVQIIAGNAAEAASLSTSAAKKLVHGNEEMGRLVVAMDGIEQSSKKISGIVKTINDIAFQTNILALNAAVEAARAGEAGQGFAVVAEEVRNLASKSSAAVQDTGNLIQLSIVSVNQGVQLAKQTAEILLAVMVEAKQSTDLVGEIAEVSKRQAASIVQVTEGVDQISSAVQMNFATSEEYAAASEELSGQAEILKKLVVRFRLE